MNVLAILQSTAATISPFGIQESLSVITFVGMLAVGYINLRERASRAESEKEHGEQLDSQAARFEEKLEDIAKERRREREQMIEKLDEMKRDMGNSFVQVPLWSAQITTFNDRINKNALEIERNRDRIHTISNDFTERFSGKIDRIDTQLTDKVRRMAAIETKLEAIDGMLHDVINRMLDAAGRK